MNKQTTEQAFKQKVAALPKELTPERDLWVGIERAIEHKTQNNEASLKNDLKTKPYLWASAASFFALAILVLMTKLSPPSSISSPDLITMMGNNFEQQKVTLLVSFGQPDLAQLPELMQQQLTQLAAARKAITQALADDQDNVDLINLLDWTQKQELELITKLYTPQWQTI